MKVDGNGGKKNGRGAHVKKGAMNGHPEKCGKSLHNCRECGRKYRAGETACPIDQSSRACEDIPMPNGCCWRHGGRNLSGPNHPRGGVFKYSKHLPSDLVEVYQDIAGDKELGDVKAEIGLNGTLLFDLLDRFREERESDDLWLKLRGLLKKLRSARSEKDAQAYLLQIGQIIDQGAELIDLKDAITKGVETHRKLAETHHKILRDKQQMISTDRIITLLGALVALLQASVTKHIGDPMENPLSKSLMSDVVKGIRGLVGNRSKANH